MAFWNSKEISPVTLDEFNEWIDDVIALTRLPNNDSMRFAVSTVVLEAKDVYKRQGGNGGTGVSGNGGQLIIQWIA